jgi:hypothetical protein
MQSLEEETHQIDQIVFQEVFQEVCGQILQDVQEQAEEVFHPRAVLSLTWAKKMPLQIGRLFGFCVWAQLALIQSIPDLRLLV